MLALGSDHPLDAHFNDEEDLVWRIALNDLSSRKDWRMDGRQTNIFNCQREFLPGREAKSLERRRWDSVSGVYSNDQYASL